MWKEDKYCLNVTVHQHISFLPLMVKTEEHSKDVVRRVSVKKWVSLEEVIDWITLHAAISLA